MIDKSVTSDRSSSDRSGSDRPTKIGRDPEQTTAPLPVDFGAVETWVFDLDNTLYSPHHRLLDKITERMTHFMMRELGIGRPAAERLRGTYFARHGITLTGLIEEHGVDHEHFLADVHDIDYSSLRPDAALNTAIAGLGREGRRLIVHTNGARGHASRVLERIGLSDAFHAIYAIEDKALIPKPGPEAYARVLAADGFAPERAAMIEDTVENLTVPKALGMATVWVCHEEGAKAPVFVDRRVTHLTRFLRTI
ncbi:MAG: pyrimidine 5'-nucleotidase [Pseudomonadota bacterium]